MPRHAPVIMIGLDAAEVTLVDRLCGEGKLPALAALRTRGATGALASDARLFAGGVWPDLYTGRPVPWHGVYHNKLWRHEAMRCEVAADSWLPARPFWDALDAAGYRVAAIDVPMTIATPMATRGIRLAGWGTHDLVVKGAWPADLWGRLEREFGRPIMPPERIGPQSGTTLERLADALVAGTEQLARMSAALLSREQWDLFIVVFGAPHRGGHYLWDLSQVDLARVAAATRRRLEGALERIYRACDAALARLLERAPAGARLVVFAAHGMGPNPGWADRCADVAAAIQRGGAGAPKTGWLYRVKRALPLPLVREVTARLPQPVLNRLVGLWSAGMFDWRTTAWFPVPMDHAGYLRLNVQGREPQGIVQPGAPYRALCDEVSEALLGFRDADSGERIVERVYRLDEIAPAPAPCRDRLPDLVVTWGDLPAARCRRIRSPRYGEIAWDGDGRLPSGRAGNHRPGGWFTAVGEGIAEGSRCDGRHVIDLAPTVLEWLGGTSLASRGEAALTPEGPPVSPTPVR